MSLSKILKISCGIIGVGAILCIIPASVVSCSKTSSNNQSNSNTITTIVNSWQTQFDNLKNQSNFKNQIATWLTNYANNLTSYFAAFTNQYQTLTKAILPTGLNGYASSYLSLNIAFPNINKSNNNIKENTTLYWKINQVSFD